MSQLPSHPTRSLASCRKTEAVHAGSPSWSGTKHDGRCLAAWQSLVDEQAQPCTNHSFPAPNHHRGLPKPG